MSKIAKVIASKGLTGFYFDDQAAIKGNAEEDGFIYKGEPKTEGFKAVRQAGESISVMIVSDDGQVAYGDCAAVQYSGAGGRDPLFLAEDFIPIIEKEIAPILVGQELDSFRKLAGKIDRCKINGKLLHTALRYGITQALLDAVAKARKITRTEVVAEEYELEIDPTPIPIFSQSGDSRYTNADKMIIKKVDVLPHALINNVSKLGVSGEKLIDYIQWLKGRIKENAPAEYQPIFHIDVYGTIGEAFKGDIPAMVEYFGKLEKAATPFKLRIEGPMDAGSKNEQIKQMKLLREGLKEQHINVEIVADEWCNTLEDIKDFVDEKVADMIQVKTPDLGGINNTIEAVLYCKQNGVGAYQGGTCNETERSGQICVDIALATRPCQILAKPGMGVDEGVMITYNEMNRVLALLKAKEN